MSSEVEILCNQDDCGLVSPARIAVVKDQRYVISHDGKISAFEGMSNDALNKNFTKTISWQNGAINIYLLLAAQLLFVRYYLKLMLGLHKCM